MDEIGAFAPEHICTRQAFARTTAKRVLISKGHSPSLWRKVPIPRPFCFGHQCTRSAENALVGCQSCAWESLSTLSGTPGSGLFTVYPRAEAGRYTRGRRAEFLSPRVLRSFAGGKRTTAENHGAIWRPSQRFPPCDGSANFIRNSSISSSHRNGQKKKNLRQFLGIAPKSWRDLFWFCVFFFCFRARSQVNFTY